MRSLFYKVIHITSEKVPFVYSFSGKSLTIGKHKIRLGIPDREFSATKIEVAIAYRGYHLNAIADKALVLNTGVRALTRIINDSLKDIEFQHCFLNDC